MKKYKDHVIAVFGIIIVSAITLFINQAVKDVSNDQYVKKESIRQNQLATLNQHREERGLLTKLPLLFVENKGQWEEDVKFMARKGNMATQFKDHQINLNIENRILENVVTGVMLKLTFENSLKDSALKGEDVQLAKFNYFLGNNPDNWKAGASTYRSIVYDNIYEGIDIKFYEGNEMLEYDLRLEPYADLDQVVIRVDGVEGLEVDSKGDLIMQTAKGPIKQTIPETYYQLASGEKSLVEAHFKIIDEQCYGIDVPNRDERLALVIDPGIEWSTFLGGSMADIVSAMDRNDKNLLAVVGQTSSGDFPKHTGTYDAVLDGPFDVFVTLMTDDGTSLVASTYLGGSSTEKPNDVMFGTDVEVAVVGTTMSSDFPTTSQAFDSVLDGNSDVFITVVRSSSSILPGLETLEYSSYIGGSGEDVATTIHEVPQPLLTNEFLIGGYTNSTDFPTYPGSYDEFYNGGINDGFILRVDTNIGVNYYSTYLGGSDDDRVHDIDLEPTSGSYYIGGTTNSSDFPTVGGAFDPTLNSGYDMFLSRMKLELHDPVQLEYSTYLGGDGDELKTALVSWDHQDLIVSGYSNSTNFPTTTGAYNETFNGSVSQVVARLIPDGSIFPPQNQLIYSTYFGEGVNYISNDERAILAVDASQSVIVAGSTVSSNFPTTSGALSTTLNGPNDSYLARLRLAGQSSDDLQYSTYLGGNSEEYSQDILLNENGAVILTGATLSQDYPTTAGSYDMIPNGGFDTYITQLDLLPTGVIRYGDSTSGGSSSCPEYIAMSVTDMPQPSASNFAFTASGAPENATGRLIIGTAKDPGTVYFGGVIALVDPLGVIADLPAVSGPFGYAEVPVPMINPSDVGVQVFAQFLWFNTPSCGGAGTLSASDALDVTIQP